MRALRAAEAVIARACGVLVVALAVTSGACASGAKLASGPNARPVPDSITHTLCTGEFGGDGAQIQVWRERDGTFVVFELKPDITKHGGHAPTTFYDDGAREVLRIASQAVAPSSPQALEADRRRESVTLEGKRAEIIGCKGK